MLSNNREEGGGHGQVEEAITLGLVSGIESVCQFFELIIVFGVLNIVGEVIEVGGEFLNVFRAKRLSAYTVYNDLTEMFIRPWTTGSPNQSKILR